MTDRCILCGFVLDERAVTVTEGQLCSDSMGCRRRALRQIHDLRAALDQTHDLVRRIERAGRQATEEGATVRPENVP